MLSSCLFGDGVGGSLSRVLQIALFVDNSNAFLPKKDSNRSRAVNGYIMNNQATQKERLE